MSCKHLNFHADCKVARIEDLGRFVLEVRVRCVDCKKPFQFVGVEPGFNYNAPTVSLDGLEGNFPITPEGQQPNPLQAAMGYTVKGMN